MRKNKLVGKIPGAGRKKGSEVNKRTVYLTKEADEIYSNVTENKTEFISRAVINESKKKRPALRSEESKKDKAKLKDDDNL